MDLPSAERPFPRMMLGVTIALSIIPFLLTLAGVDFSAPARTGATIYTLFEWTAFGMGVAAFLLAMLHYQLRGDVTFAIIGLALLCAGLVDGLAALVASGVLLSVHDEAQFLPFIWVLSRTFNAGILLAGAVIFVLGGDASGAQRRIRGSGIVLIFAVVCVCLAVGTVYMAATRATLPNMQRPDALVSRPWDLLPLSLFMIGALLIFPVFAKWHPSSFASALLISMIPHIAAQLHMTFGSEVLYDSHFNVACFLKLVAYFIPIHGLREDYRTTYQLEVAGKAALADELLVREQTADAMARDRSLINTLMKHVPLPIYVKDASLRFLRLNPAQLKVLGLKTETDAIGMKATDLPNHDAIKISEDQERQVLNLGHPMGDALPLKGKDGKVLGVVGISRRHEGPPPTARRTV